MQGAVEYNCPLPRPSLFGCGEAALGTHVGVWLQSLDNISELGRAIQVTEPTPECDTVFSCPAASYTNFLKDGIT